MKNTLMLLGVILVLNGCGNGDCCVNEDYVIEKVVTSGIPKGEDMNISIGENPTYEELWTYKGLFTHCEKEEAQWFIESNNERCDKVNGEYILDVNETKELVTYSVTCYLEI